MHLPDDLRRNAIPVFLLSIFSSGLNYIFQIIVARHLGPASYSIFGSILAGMSVVATAVSALQAIEARAVTLTSESTSAAIRTGAWFWRTMTALFGLSLCLFMFAPVVGSKLGVAWLVIGIAALCPVPFALAAIASGRLQGKGRFVEMSLFAGSLSIAKLALALSIVGSNLGLLAMIVSLLVPPAGISIFVIRHLKVPAASEEYRLGAKTASTAVSMTLIWSFVGMDCALAPVFLNHSSAGDFVLGSTLGKIAVWIVASIIDLIFPSVVRDVKSTSDSKVNGLTLFALVSTIAIAIATFAGLVPESLMNHLVGDAYGNYLNTTAIISISAIPFFITYLTNFKLVAYSHHGLVVSPLLGLGAFCFWMLVFGSPASPNEYARDVLVVYVVVAICSQIESGVVRKYHRLLNLAGAG